MLDGLSPLSAGFPYRIGLAHSRFASPPISRDTLDLLTPSAKAGWRDLPATLEALPVVMPANRPCGVDTDRPAQIGYWLSDHRREQLRDDRGDGPRLWTPRFWQVCGWGHVLPMNRLRLCSPNDLAGAIHGLIVSR